MEKIIILREDACGKLGLKHPAYIVLDKLNEAKKSGSPASLEVETDDVDWAITIKTIAENAGFKVTQASRGSRLVLYITG